MILTRPPKTIIKYLENSLVSIDLDSIYKKMENNFTSHEMACSNEGFEFIDKKFINSKFNHILSDYNSLIGIDLPVFYTSLNKKNKKIAFILGQDPLRSINDFGDKSEIIIGTPFALHSEYYRKKRTKLYWKIIRSLCENNYTVYVTDAIKIWAKNINFGTGYNLKYLFSELLRNELITINPDIVLSMGNIAQKTLCNAGPTCEFKHVLHPRARKKDWEKYGLVNFQDDMKVKYILENRFNIKNFSC